LGNTLEVEIPRVNDLSVVKDGVGTCHSRELVVPSGDAECLLGDAFVLAIEVGEEVGVGPYAFQPKALRTKAGDIPLRGVVSKRYVEDGEAPVDVLGPTNDPVGQCSNPAISIVPNESQHFSPPLLTYPERGKGGRTKKIPKKTIPYPPGSKFSKFQELSKGGRNAKKKKSIQGALENQLTPSEESDPITSSEEEVEATHFQRFCDMGGIGLEVVLSRSDDEREAVAESGFPMSMVGSGGCGGSGLRVILSDVVPIQSNRQQEGVLVDKEKRDAYHLVDIQKDVGMIFNGKGEEDVERSMLYEGRDRQKKSEWVQGVSDQ
jgi:hypothetical protein